MDKDLLDKLNKVGPGFCAAKWYNSTIWLSNGRTSSCHHPPAHSIDVDEIEKDPSALHNTKIKKQARLEMLQGGRPDECGYCWKVEDSSASAISDRVYKSKIYTDDQLKKIAEASPHTHINPTTVEISFDNLCNLACTYCNSEFSSTWNSDISRNGGYQLDTPEGQTYNNLYKFDANIVKEQTPYAKAFFRWLDSGLSDDLTELRITGGEPTMSPSFWQFIDTIDNPKFSVAVNTNMCMSTSVLDKFINATNKFDDFHLYTSAESSPKISELVRGGFTWDVWYNNIETFITEANYKSINIMMTISLLSLPGLVEFLDNIIKLKQKHSNTIITMSANILRFPSFQSVNNLPLHLKERYSNDIKHWLNINKAYVIDFEYEHLLRVCEYLDTVEKSYEDKDSSINKMKDLSSFINQYSTRRYLDISDIYESDFLAWIETLNK